jgi:hypothetical protein
MLILAFQLALVSAWLKVQSGEPEAAIEPLVPTPGSCAAA